MLVKIASRIWSIFKYFLSMINSNNKTEFRVAKIIARSGYCSRRKAESLIHQKKVRINGELIQSPAINISL